MRKELVLVFIFLLFGFSFVAAAKCSNSDQIIMKLGSSSNSHVSAWDQSPSYEEEICYTDVFGFDYSGEDPHVCDGANRILSLADPNNSHAATTSDVNYNYEVCYGDLSCEYDSSPGDDCANGGSIVARMYSVNNTHVSKGNVAGYTVKVCCNTAGIYWADMNGKEITESWLGESVQMITRGIGYGDFEIFEADDIDDDDIRVGDSAIPGEASDSKWVGTWDITNADVDAADDNLIFPFPEEDFKGFYFEIGGEVSKALEVHPYGKPGDMNVTLISPECASYYNESTNLSIVINASDTRSKITGKVTFDGKEIPFSNGFHVFNRTLNNPGSLQIVVDASNEEGDKVRIVSNIMVLDLDDSDDYELGDYVAACIFEPKDFSAIDTSMVFIDASTTSGIIVNDSGFYELEPGRDPFTWHWRFYDPSGQEYKDSERILVDSVDVLAYKFYKEFPVAGDNSATLSVSI